MDNVNCPVGQNGRNEEMNIEKQDTIFCQEHINGAGFHGGCYMYGVCDQSVFYPYIK